MRKHLNNLYVQYVLTAIFCFGFFCVPPHIFFFVTWHIVFLDTLCFLTLVFLNTLGFWIQRFVYLFFLETVFFFVPFFFFSSLFISNYFSRTSYLYDSWLCIFFFFFFFFPRQLICENTSITCIYIWDEITAKFWFGFFFVCTAKHIFVSWNFVFLCIWRQSFEHLFFSRDVVFLCFMAFFLFFFGQFLSVFLTSLNFLRVFLFFFFLLFFYCWD